jgi:uncharacterized protein YkwD
MSIRFCVACGMATLVILSTAWGGAPPAEQALPLYTGCGEDLAPVVNASYEQQVVELVNAVRDDNGLPPLKRLSELDEAARYHATDMGQDDYFEHETYDRVGGSLVEQCDTVTRIRKYCTECGSWAENIGWGCATPQCAMDLWMNSSGHRANILSTSTWEIGVGYHTGSASYPHLWVQDFGQRSGIYPLIINGEAATTDDRDVSLYVYGEWDEIRLRNDSGTWTSWQPFQSTLAWTLNSGTGDHTVQAEMRSDGQTATASDAIYLEDSSVTFFYVYLPLVGKDVP